MTNPAGGFLQGKYEEYIRAHNSAGVIQIWKIDRKTDDVCINENGLPSLEEIIVQWLEDGYCGEAEPLIQYYLGGNDWSKKYVITKYVRSERGDVIAESDWSNEALIAGQRSGVQWTVPFVLIAWSEIGLDREVVWETLVRPGHAEPYLDTLLHCIVRLSVDQDKWLRELIRNCPDLALEVYQHHPNPGERLGRLVIRRLPEDRIHETMCYLLSRLEWGLLRYHRECHPDAWVQLD